MSEPKCYGSAKVEIREGVISTDCLMCSVEDRCMREYAARKEYEEGFRYRFGGGRLEAYEKARAQAWEAYREATAQETREKALVELEEAGRRAERNENAISGRPIQEH